MAEYGHLTDDELVAELRAMQAREGVESQQAVAAAKASLQGEVDRRVRAAQIQAREGVDARIAQHAEYYRGLPAKLEGEVRQWRPPPHPRPGRAFDAELSPQLSNSVEWRLWNKPHVSTGAMWERDNRAAELARRLQAERQAAAKAGSEQLAAFDETLPGVDLLDTSVSDTWRPGWEQWGLLHKGLSLPSAALSAVGGLGQQAFGHAASAFGIPNKAADDADALAWQTFNAADDATGNIGTGVYNMLTGDNRYAPGYQRHYWDEIQQRAAAPLSVLRPRDIQPKPSVLSADTQRYAAEYSDDMLKGTGLSDAAKAGISVAAAFGAGAITDPIMPDYFSAPSHMARLKMLGKDAAVAAGLMSGSTAAASGLMDRKDLDQQELERFYSDLIQRLQSQNRITK